MGAGPLIVMDTDVNGSIRSKPLYSFFISSSEQMLTPLSPTLPYISGRIAGSSPYNVTESTAVDSRFASSSFDRYWKRRLVRSGDPSPANCLVGSSPCRLNGNTPAANGKETGTFSFINHVKRSPQS